MAKMTTANDGRLGLMAAEAAKKLKEKTDEILPYFMQSAEVLGPLLADREKFHYLFFWRTKPEEEEEEPVVDADEFELAKPQKVYDSFKFDVDTLSKQRSPLDLQIAFFARKKPGYISAEDGGDPEHRNFRMLEKYLRCGTITEDPLIILHDIFQKESSTAISLPDLYSKTQIENFKETIRSFSATEKALITVPRKWYTFAVPFPPEQELDESEVSELSAVCLAWNLLVKEIITDIQKHKFDDSKFEEIIAIPKEYEWWEERSRHVKLIQQQLNKPEVRRTIFILEKINPAEATVFNNTKAMIDTSLEEALDNMKFLKSIRRHVEVCSNAESFALIRATLHKVMKSLRNAWMLSKYYNTDERILSLLHKITSILLVRVYKYIKLEELTQPLILKEKTQNSLSLLNEWEEAFHATRIAIEKSDRETRWEFSVQHIFAPIQHAKRICKNVIWIVTELANLQSCFSPALDQATKKSAILDTAKEKINEFVKSFNDLTFNLFSDASLHHWENHLSWFSREIRFLEVSSVSLLKEVFSELNSAKLAMMAIVKMLSQGHNTFIGKSILSSIPKVISQFHHEVCISIEFFQTNRESPPIKEEVPPISGSIYWANSIIEKLDDTLNHMKAVPDIASEETWSPAETMYLNFRRELKDYKQSQYQEWCNKVSDILDQNLTRPLLVTFICPETRLRKYQVNFTEDLTHTLAEVDHLENLGFSVPEVARNMSDQKGQLTSLAESLQAMIDDYHDAVSTLHPAEVELLSNEISLVHQALRAGHLRLTWNNLAIRESCLDIGSRSISVFKSNMQQVHLIKNNLTDSVQAIRNGQLFSIEANFGTTRLDEFEEFTSKSLKGIKLEFRRLLAHAQFMTPCLVRIEELLFFSRSLCAEGMAKYYTYWENQLYLAVVDMITNNLEVFRSIVKEKKYAFTIRSVLEAVDVILEPSAATVVEGLLSIVKEVLDGSRCFVRFYRSTWLPVKPEFSTNDTREIVPSFHEDIVTLKPIKDKVEEIQNIVLQTMKNIHVYLLEWKSFRSLWLYSKEKTCKRFIVGFPTCVGFDEKLLFYYNIYKLISSKTDECNFNCINLNTRPLKAGILEHVKEWISTLGALLEDTAQIRLDNILETVESYSEELKPVTELPQVDTMILLVSNIEKISLEVELSFNDIEERCRTLEMYDIKSTKDILTRAQVLPQTWMQLYMRSKDVSYKLAKVKERKRAKLRNKVERFVEKVSIVLRNFHRDGPFGQDLSLEDSFSSLQLFFDKVKIIRSIAEDLNSQQKILKEPITNFQTLDLLEQEIASNSKILDVFNKFKEAQQILGNTEFQYMKKIYEGNLIQNLCDKLITMRKDCDNLVMLERLQKEIENTKSICEQLYALFTLSLDDRHWKKMVNVYLNQPDICRGSHEEDAMEEQGTELLFKERRWLILPFFQLDLRILKESVQNIIKYVEYEKKIEGELEQISNFWAEAKFHFQKWHALEDPRLSLLTITESVAEFENLERNIAALNDMIHDDRTAYFKSSLLAEKKTLQEMMGTLQLWIGVQDTCLTLARILLWKHQESSAVNLKEKYEEDFKQFSKMMNEVAKKPLIQKNSLNSGIKEKLNYFLKAFSLHVSKCSNLISSKKKELPRLNFLSYSDNLIIIGGWICGNVDSFQKTVRKLFIDGVCGLIVDGKLVQGVETSDGEQLRFRKDIICHSNAIDTCLNKVISETHVTLNNLCQQRLSSGDLNLRTLNWPLFNNMLHQVSYIVHEVLWTKEVEESFAQGKPSDKFKECHKFLTYLLLDCYKELESSNELSVFQRKKLLNFINLSISKRNMVYDFLDQMVVKASDFKWKAILKTKFDSQTSRIYLEQGKVRLDYEYEFGPVYTLPLVTSDMRWSHFAMSIAIAAHQPLLLSGQPLSGKKTCLLDFITRLGSFYTSLTVGSHSTCDQLRQSLAYLCEANCWGIVEGIDHCKYSVLSSLTRFFQDINKAQSLKIRNFRLGGTETKMGFSTVISFISRNGFGDQKKYIPLSVLSQFRHVSILKPSTRTLISSKLGKFDRETNRHLDYLASYITMTVQHLPPKCISETSVALQIFGKLKNAQTTQNSKSFLESLWNQAIQVLINLLSNAYGSVLRPALLKFPSLPVTPIEDSPLTSLNEAWDQVLAQKSPVILIFWSVLRDESSLVQSLKNSRTDLARSIAYYPLNSYTLDDIVGFSEDTDSLKQQRGILRSITKTSYTNLKEHLPILEWPSEEVQFAVLKSIYEEKDHFRPIILCPEKKLQNSPSSSPLLHNLPIIRIRLPEDVEIKAKSKDLNKHFLVLLNLWRTRTSNPFPAKEHSKFQSMIRMMDMMSEAWDTEKSLQTVCNLMLYCFCWSFATDEIDLEGDSQFIGDIGSIAKARDGPYSLLQEYSVVSQRYDPEARAWIYMGNLLKSFLHLCEQLTLHCQHIFFDGLDFGTLLLDTVLRHLRDIHDNLDFIEVKKLNNFCKDLKPDEETNVLQPEKLTVVVVRDFSSVKDSDLRLLYDVVKSNPILLNSDKKGGKYLRNVVIVGYGSKAFLKKQFLLQSPSLMYDFHVFSFSPVQNDTFFTYLSNANSAISTDECKILREVFADISQQEWRCQADFSRFAFSQIFKKSPFENWMDNLSALLYLPLINNEDRNAMADIFKKYSLNSSFDYDGDEFPSNVPQVTRVFKHIMKICFTKATLNIISVIGGKGCGKHSAIKSLCQDLGKTYQDSEEWKSEKHRFFDVIGLTVHENKLAQLDQALEQASQFRSKKYVLYIALDASKKVKVQKVYELIQAHSICVAFPKWTDANLKRMNSEHAEEFIMDWMVQIHRGLEGQAEAFGLLRPTEDLLTLSLKQATFGIMETQDRLKRRINLLDNIFEKINSFDQHISELELEKRNLLADIRASKDRSSTAKAEIDNLEITKEKQIQAMELIMLHLGNVDRQLSALKQDVATVSSKSEMKFISAKKSIIESLADEHLEEFHVKVKDLKQVNELTPVFTSIVDNFVPNVDEIMGMTSFIAQFGQAEYHEKIEQVDPWTSSVQSAKFVSNFRKTLDTFDNDRVSSTMLDAILNFIEGFVEIQNSRDEIGDLNVRIQECELMQMNLKAEHASLATEVETISVQIKEKKANYVVLEKKSENFTDQLNSIDERVSRAKSVKSAFVKQISAWKIEQNACSLEKEQTSVKETLKAASQVYLASIPEWKRRDSYQLMSRILPLQEESYAPDHQWWTPWQDSNLLKKNEIPGIASGMVPQICSVYDPNDVISLVLGNICSISLISDKDIHTLKTMLANSKSKIVITQWKPAFLNTLMALKELDQMIYLLVDCLYKCPSKFFFINLELKPLECSYILAAKLGSEKSEDNLKTIADLHANLNKMKADIANSALSLSESDSLDPANIFSISDVIEELSEKIESNVSLSAPLMLEQLASYQIPMAMVCAAVQLSQGLGVTLPSLTFCSELIAKIEGSEGSIQLEQWKGLYLLLAQRFREDHILSFKFAIVYYLGIFQREVSAEDGDLIFGHSGDQEHQPEEGNGLICSRPEWCPERSWFHLSRKKFYGDEKTLSEKLLNREDTWKSWYSSDTTNSEMASPIRGSWVDLTIASILKPNVLEVFVSDFVQFKLPDVFHLDSQIIDLSVQVDSASPKNSIYLNSTDCVQDPASQIGQISKWRNMANAKLKFYSINPTTQESHIVDLLSTAAVRGQWLVLQNIDLNPPLARVIQKFLENSEIIHPEFLLWLTSQTNLSSSRLLQRSIEISCHTQRKFFGLAYDDSGQCNTILDKLLYYLNRLHSKYNLLSLTKTLIWHPDTYLPFNTIYRNAKEHFHILNINQHGIEGPVEADQVSTFLIKFIYSPFLHEQDVDQISVDFEEIMQVLIENCTRPDIPFPVSDVTYFLKVTKGHQLAFIEEKSQILSRILCEGVMMDDEFGDNAEDQDELLSEEQKQRIKHLLSKDPGEYFNHVSPFMVRKILSFEFRSFLQQLEQALIHHSMSRHLWKRFCYFVDEVQKQESPVVNLSLLDNPQLFLKSLSLSSGLPLNEQELVAELKPVQSLGNVQSERGILVRGLFIFGANWTLEEGLQICSNESLETPTRDGMMPLNNLILYSVDKSDISNLKYMKLPVYIHETKGNINLLGHIRVETKYYDNLQKRNIKFFIKQTNE